MTARVHNAGASFVAACPCQWREPYAYRRDAQQALGRHGETCAAGFGGRAEGGRGRQEATGGDLTASEGENVREHHHDDDDER